VIAAATITAEEFAQLLGIAPWTIYQSVRAGTCPVEPIRVGRRMVWSSAQVACLLGVESLSAPNCPVHLPDEICADDLGSES
jgi:predicted DNA-binding transcriptional regulator AlpA